ncbi:HlyD family efflux transporter periplasmic adaptor subunit [Microcoleus sp. herbarium7]|uniref:HlyD family efflux transporter periplasmic adaptor subunit n=1 Tax=Microcoleus sp. herbarium7 TaxID=3055435 RepID=UPI002FD65FCF
MTGDSSFDFLRSAKPDEFLPPVSRWITAGGLFLLATFGGAIALAAVAKYNVTVRAPATVRPAGEIRIVEAATAGTVKSIQVKENQAVKQGDTIALIDSSQLLTKQSQLQGNIQQNQLQLRQIAAQISALDDRLAAETQAMAGAVASARADVSRSQREYEERQMTSLAEVEAAKANLQLAQSEWEKSLPELQKEQATLQTATANFKAAEANLKAAVSKRDRYQSIQETGAISLDLLQETKLAAQQQAQAVAGQKAAVEAQKQAVASQRKTVDRQRQAVEFSAAKLKVVEAALNPSAAPIAIAQQRIAQEKAKGEAALAALKKEQLVSIQSRADIENQIDRDRQELKQIDTELAKSVIRSPADGTILKLNLRNPGQTAQLGAAIAQIAPANAAIVIKARVAATDIGKIAIGQTSILRISAYPYPDYGVLEGKVSAIAPDVIAGENNSPPYYEVTVMPQKTYLVKGDRAISQSAYLLCCQYHIQPGMEVTADIISRQETVLTFILRKARLLADF